MGEFLAAVVGFPGLTLSCALVVAAATRLPIATGRADVATSDIVYGAIKHAPDEPGPPSYGVPR
ncbi:hypothetical protein GTY65_04965 [Streptomyces sp. SID8379]|uniref:hypothetical protein n=1 Tax=unclassified Streptomyces TaxID=2593676 RepID=UPI00035CDA43|nr:MULTISPECIES: hypothetical protein [unclassified Streptomyces]MYW63431.1 hypothetical protein [Streptomyces sp. SID8379]